MKVYEGAAGQTIDKNFLLGKFVVNGVVAKRKGEARIAVTFCIGEADGILKVTAQDTTPGWFAEW